MSTRSFLFQTASRVLFGSGSIAQLPCETASLGRRALLVTGRRSLQDSGVLARLIEGFRQTGMHVTHFCEFDGEPDIADVDEARRVISEDALNVVAAVGGGSAMDLAKAAAGLAGESAPTRAFHQGRAVEAPALPIVACPTTSGTGAEVTRNAVLSDRQSNAKKSIRGDGLLPTVALVDPELTVPCPASVTAACGMDAFTQAVESFLSVNSFPVTDALAAKAAKLIADHLPPAVADGQDMRARDALSWGSLMAGMALANARLGAIHGMAHPIGVLYHVPHGVVCAALLPHVLEINRQAREKFDPLTQVLGDDPVRTAERLIAEVGLQDHLRDYHLQRDDFETIVRDSLPSGSLAANPVPFDAARIRRVLEAVA